MLQPMADAQEVERHRDGSQVTEQFPFGNARQSLRPAFLKPLAQSAFIALHDEHGLRLGAVHHLKGREDAVGNRRQLLPEAERTWLFRRRQEMSDLRGAAGLLHLPDLAQQTSLKTFQKLK